MNRLPLNVLHAALRRLGKDYRASAGGWELQLKRSAHAELALDVNLPGVLLHDSVADGQAKTGAFGSAVLRLGFGRKERIVDAVEMFFLDAAARVLNADEHTACAVEGCNLQRCIGSAEHCVLRV